MKFIIHALYPVNTIGNVNHCMYTEPYGNHAWFFVVAIICALDQYLNIMLCSHACV